MKRNKERERNYYLKNRERLIAYSKKWVKDNAEKRNAARRAKYRADVLSGNIKKRKRYPYKPNNKCKLKVLEHYGAKCYCCGEDNIKFLNVDHINSNGREHGNGLRRYTGIALYRYLINNNFPDGIQIACFNCNFARNNNHGICPHQEEKN